jgi:hypothetical protein
MKIDVEGSEFQILNGSHHLLSNYPPYFIMMEFDRNYMKETGIDWHFTLDFLKSYKYHIFSDDCKTEQTDNYDDFFTKTEQICLIHQSILPLARS